MESTFADSPRIRSGAMKVQEGAREIKDAAVDRAVQLKDAAVTRAVELKDAAVQSSTEMVQRGADAIKQCCSATEAMVKERPFQSLLLACAVGALFGAVLLRR